MKYLLLVFIAFASLHINAKEGMWIPSLLKNLAESDMREMGMKITAEDIYSFNRSSLKDAIVHFGGGCTAEMISDQGLLLTNHHCGYGQIQSHSSVENDLLTDGFWAKDRSSELKNPGLTASFIIRIDEVTKEVLAGVTGDMAEG
ncbi:MAG: S46 family peptidase, partial [Flavobacteriales bacterium]|nr:S46 family peptidase [Flavobacteriales bacterium]